MTFIRWLRSPEGRPFRTFILWFFTVMNLTLFAKFVRDRHDAVVEVQSLRMSCEVNGGYYGAIANGAARCLTPKQTGAFEDETR